jgi:ABC-type sugar transport system substrate-binding protein
MVQEVGALQTEDNGYQLMQNLLAAHPKGTIDGVFCYNDALCVGAYRAIKQAGREKEMILGATDLNPQALDLIKAKTNYVYSIGGHWVMVGFATMIAYDYLHGHKPLSEFSRIEDVGVDSAGFEKFKEQYIDHLPSFDIKQYMLTFNPNAKTQTPPLTLK